MYKCLEVKLLFWCYILRGHPSNKTIFWGSFIRERILYWITAFIIPHILITINRLIWLDKNQNTWSHRTKIIFHPLGSLEGFPARFIVLWQENVRGTRNASFAGDRYNMVFKYLRQRSNGLEICLPAVFYIPVCFLGFIRYNKTFIACGYRKYENLFTHEYHIPLGPGNMILLGE